MGIVIFVLKLLEVFWNAMLSANYWVVTDRGCILAVTFSIFLLVPFVYLIVKKIMDKKKYLEILLVLTGFMLIWLFIFITSILNSYPLNICITRFIATISNLTIWGLYLSKWSDFKNISSDE